jgi:hypothetical protein
MIRPVIFPLSSRMIFVTGKDSAPALLEIGKTVTEKNRNQPSNRLNLMEEFLKIMEASLYFFLAVLGILA